MVELTFYACHIGKINGANGAPADGAPRHLRTGS